ncbi:hypothetical protein OIE63_21040 [Streptomyces sp. NBC_01795]|nr:hypothetical protein OIE63_21040 [Streptomyces sp. NBC_01795]
MGGPPGVRGLAMRGGGGQPHRDGARRHRHAETAWHLVLLFASFAVTAYAGVRLLADDALAVAVWLVGAALLHDLVLVPLYSLADRALRPAGRYLNHVRIPALLAALLLLVWFPLIVGPPARYARTTGHPPPDYAARWLLVTAALFAASGLWLLVRTWRDGSRRADGRRVHGRRVGGWRGQGRRSARNERSPTDH